LIKRVKRFYSYTERTVYFPGIPPEMAGLHFGAPAALSTPHASGFEYNGAAEGMPK
jgi:hypothetical protein